MDLEFAETVDVAELGGEPTRHRELRRRGRETITRLLEAGEAVIEERGHDNARVDDVVARADVSHGTFYLYFRDLEDLLASLVKVAAARMLPLAAALPARADVSSLAAWFEVIERAFDRHVEVLRAAQSMGDDGAVSVLVDPLAVCLRRAGGSDAALVSRMMMAHFASAIVRADILDEVALARVTLRAAGIEVADEHGTASHAGPATGAR